MKVIDENKDQSYKTNIESAESFGICLTPSTFKVLTKDLYQNPKMAIVREILCNAIDAGGDIYIDIPDSFNPTFCIEDTGIGMTLYEIRKYCTNYFSSDKNMSNDKIGGFGLGSKTPFAYVDQYVIESCKNGEKNAVLAFKDEKGMSSSKVLVSEPCSNHGTKVYFSVKSEDFDTFSRDVQKCIIFSKKLPIIRHGKIDFERKFIENYSTVEINKLKNDKEIEEVYDDILKRSRNFYLDETQLSSLYSDRNAFKEKSKLTCFEKADCNKILIMAGVPYEIDLFKLSDKFKSSFACNFIESGKSCGFFITCNIGDVEISPSREVLSYDEKTISFVENKIKEKVYKINNDVFSKIDSLPKLFKIENFLRSFNYNDFIKSIFSKIDSLFIDYCKPSLEKPTKEDINKIIQSYDLKDFTPEISNNIKNILLKNSEAFFNILSTTAASKGFTYYIIEKKDSIYVDSKYIDVYKYSYDNCGGECLISIIQSLIEADRSFLTIDDMAFYSGVSKTPLQAKIGTKRILSEAFKKYGNKIFVMHKYFSSVPHFISEIDKKVESIDEIEINLTKREKIVNTKIKTDFFRNKYTEYQCSKVEEKDVVHFAITNPYFTGIIFPNVEKGNKMSLCDNSSFYEIKDRNDGRETFYDLEKAIKFFNKNFSLKDDFSYISYSAYKNMCQYIDTSKNVMYLMGDAILENKDCILKKLKSKAKLPYFNTKIYGYDYYFNNIKDKNSLFIECLKKKKIESSVDLRIFYEINKIFEHISLKFCFKEEKNKNYFNSVVDALHDILVYDENSDSKSEEEEKFFKEYPMLLGFYKHESKFNRGYIYYNTEKSGYSDIDKETKSEFDTYVAEITNYVNTLNRNNLTVNI